MTRDTATVAARKKLLPPHRYAGYPLQPGNLPVLTAAAGPYFGAGRQRLGVAHYADDYERDTMRWVVTADPPLLDLLNRYMVHGDEDADLDMPYPEYVAAVDALRNANRPMDTHHEAVTAIRMLLENVPEVRGDRPTIASPDVGKVVPTDNTVKDLADLLTDIEYEARHLQRTFEHDPLDDYIENLLYGLEDLISDAQDAWRKQKSLLGVTYMLEKDDSCLYHS